MQIVCIYKIYIYIMYLPENCINVKFKVVNVMYVCM